MNIYKYAVRSFRHNAGKGIIFAIALSVLLLIGVLNIATSIQQTVYREAVSSGGDAHARYNFITSEQAALIANHGSVEWSDLWLKLRAWGVVEKEENIVDIVYSTRMGQMENFKLEKGCAPQALDEVALHPHTARLLGAEPKVGEKIAITIESFDNDITSLNDASKTHYTEHEFTISGVMQDQPYHERIGYNVLFVSEQFIMENGSFSEQYGREFSGYGTQHDFRSLFVHFKRGYYPVDMSGELANLAGVDSNNFDTNLIYIQASLNDPAAILAVCGILGVLMLTGAMVIGNVFGMMTARRTRSFGMLTLIGASKRQIRRCVYIEALLCTAVALPIGLILGTGFSYIGMAVLIENAMSEMFIPEFYAAPWAYALTIALACAMTFFGVMRPAHRASKAAPVEAVRFAGEVEKYKKRKEQRHITTAVLAKLNMKRHRRRTASITVSLSLSGMLFLGVSNVGLSLFSSAENNARSEVAGDIQVMAGDEWYYMKSDWALSPSVIEKLRAMDSVANMKTFMTQGYCDNYAESDGYLRPVNSGEILGVEIETLRELMGLVKEGSPTFDELTGSASAYDPVSDDPVSDDPVSDDPVSDEPISDTPVSDGQSGGIPVLAVNSEDPWSKPFNKKLEQTFDVYLRDSGGQATDRKATLRVVGIIDREDMPPYLDYWWGVLPTLVMTQGAFEQNGFYTPIQSVSIDAVPALHDELLAAVRNLCEQSDELYFKSLKLLTQEFEQQVAGTMGLVFMVLFIIALVGILNLISSTFIGIAQRQREFGVLIALGLSPKGLRSLLTREGVTVSLNSIIMSTVLGLSLGYGMYYFLSEIGGAIYVSYVFPTVPLIGLLLVYGLVPYIVQSVAVRRLSRQTTVELLGQEA